MDWIKNHLEKTLLELFPQNGNTLYEAARYSLEGGKRLRPLLTLLVLEIFDTPVEKGLYPAAAIEMVHTYSLIHDDLPCMDDDDFRRGKPSLHRAYSEDQAILTGDFLLTYAFETLAKAPHLSDFEKIDLVATLSRYAGAQGMIEGQLLDLKQDFGKWEEMYAKKTGALFSAALEFGAILAHADKEPFHRIGTDLGIAFQLLDDLKDEDGIVKIYGKEQTEEWARNYLEELKQSIDIIPRDASKLHHFIQEMWACL